MIAFPYMIDLRTDADDVVVEFASRADDDGNVVDTQDNREGSVHNTNVSNASNGSVYVDGAGEKEQNTVGKETPIMKMKVGTSGERNLVLQRGDKIVPVQTTSSSTGTKCMCITKRHVFVPTTISDKTRRRCLWVYGALFILSLVCVALLIHMVMLLDSTGSDVQTVIAKTTDYVNVTMVNGVNNLTDVLVQIIDQIGVVADAAEACRIRGDISDATATAVGQNLGRTYSQWHSHSLNLWACLSLSSTRLADDLKVIYTSCRGRNEKYLIRNER